MLFVRREVMKKCLNAKFVIAYFLSNSHYWLKDFLISQIMINFADIPND